jgi:O-acetyl-ADP-ribose deacetylase (regulator of RNase III)
VDELRVNDRVIRLQVGFITEAAADGMVYYASPDLVLGAGFGTAISVQGGPKIQEELKKAAPARLGEVVVTGGGNLPVKAILHAVGPRFQEADSEAKLKAVTLTVLHKAEEQRLQTIVFPAMGAGFYGIPLEVTARVTLTVVREFLAGAAELKTVLFCLRDNWELKHFQEQLQKLA